MDEQIKIDDEELNKLFRALNGFFLKVKKEIKAHPSPTIKVFKHLDQIGESLGIEVKTLSVLMVNESARQHYFPDLPEGDWVIVNQHYFSAIARHFIMDLASAVEAGIRTFIDSGSGGKPHGKDVSFKKYCINNGIEIDDDQMEEISTKFFNEGFVDFQRYQDQLPPQLREKYKEFLRIIQTSRNASHNGYDYKGRDIATMDYRGMTYTFRDGDEVRFDIRQSVLFLEEALELFRELY